MKLLDRDLVRRSTFGLLSALLLPGLLVVGCVSLTKPLDVQRCSANSTCSDDPNKVVPPSDDAKKDPVVDPSPDLPSDEEMPIIKPDAGPDVLPSGPDVPPDTGDAATDNKDTTSADTNRPAEVADASPPPADVPAEKPTGAEPGPEPPAAEPGPEPSTGPERGPEPSTGPEPGPEPSTGPEPGPEPKPEPGPEPKPELGPEPGPELPRDGGPGTPDTAPPSNCNIFYGASPSTGSQGHPPGPNSNSAFCVATCDDIAGWGCSNDPGRIYTVNGTVVTCGATIAKKNGYYVIQVSAGTNTSAAVYWWVGSNLWASSCPAPAGGVFP